jgi:catalase
MNKLTAALMAAASIASPIVVHAVDTNVNTEIVDALNARYGVHPGFRSNHAKGVVVEGSFTPTPRAAELSRSPLFTGATLPVTVRFSDASGLPDLHDAALLARPHGMAIKFHLPDGVDSDIVANRRRDEPARCAKVAATRSIPQPSSERRESNCHSRHTRQFCRRTV